MNKGRVAILSIVNEAQIPIQGVWGKLPALLLSIDAAALEGAWGPLSC